MESAMLSEEEFLTAISDYIRKKRLENNISCEKLAELCEMDYSSVNLIENKKQNPRSYSLYKILSNLDFDIANMVVNTDYSPSIQEKLVKKIRSMPEEHQRSLLKFISEFEIKLK